MLRRALAEYPDDPGLMSALATALLEADETKEALRWAQRAFAQTALVDDGLIVVEALGRRLRFGKAAALARELVVAAPDDPLVLTQLATVLAFFATFSRKAYRDGMAAAERAAMLAPDDPEPRVAMAALYWADDSLFKGHKPAKRAAEILRKVLAEDPENAAAKTVLIEVQEALGDHSAALATGITAARQAPGDPAVASLPTRPVLGFVWQAAGFWLWGCLLIAHYGLKYGGWVGLLALPVLAAAVSSGVSWLGLRGTEETDRESWRRAVRQFKAGDYLFWWRPLLLAPMPFAVLLAVRGELGWVECLAATALVATWVWPTEGRGNRWSATRSSLIGYGLGDRAEDPAFPRVRGLVAQACWAAALGALAAFMAGASATLAVWLVMASYTAAPLIVGIVAPAAYLYPAWRARPTSLVGDMWRRDPRLLVMAIVSVCVALVSAASFGVPDLRPILLNAALVAAAAGAWARCTLRTGGVADADVLS